MLAEVSWSGVATIAALLFVLYVVRHVIRANREVILETHAVMEEVIKLLRDLHDDNVDTANVLKTADKKVTRNVRSS